MQEQPHTVAALTTLIIGQKMGRYGRGEENSFLTWGTETGSWQSNRLYQSSQLGPSIIGFSNMGFCKLLLLCGLFYKIFHAEGIKAITKSVMTSNVDPFHTSFVHFEPQFLRVTLWSGVNLHFQMHELSLRIARFSVTFLSLIYATSKVIFA